jgi:hypothetical protein
MTPLPHLDKISHHHPATVLLTTLAHPATVGSTSTIQTNLLALPLPLPHQATLKMVRSFLAPVQTHVSSTIQKIRPVLKASVPTHVKIVSYLEIKQHAWRSLG